MHQLGKAPSTYNETDESASPVFNYVKKQLVRYIVIIDDSAEINIRDSYQFLRDAIRKWIEKDLNHFSTELGIWMFGNYSNSGQRLKSLVDNDDREEIFSNLDWYIDNFRKGQKCIIDVVHHATNFLKQNSRNYGKADNNIILIGPGMVKCADDKTQMVLDLAKGENIKISTINYPNIGANRVEFDQIAIQTRGQYYTVIEKKQNEQQSLLTTFFELTNILVQISNDHSSDETVSVEIYRKKLIDSKVRGENRQTIDSFTVGGETNSINFFVYIYDRREKNIEKGMKLISPNKQEYTTSSELRAEYHQLTITGNLTGMNSNN